MYWQGTPDRVATAYPGLMDSRSDIREFFVTRRARISPERVNLPSYGTRRVPGLRREEVAALAGVSVDYYNRLERGNLAGVSETVLEAIANALQLDEAERLHLHRLARAANSAPRSRTASVETTTPEPKHSAGARRNDRGGLDRAERPDGSAGRQHARPGALLTGLRRRTGDPEPRPFRIHESRGARTLPRLGRRGQRRGRTAPHRSRADSRERRVVRPRRGAVDPVR